MESGRADSEMERLKTSCLVGRNPSGKESVLCRFVANTTDLLSAQNRTESHKSAVSPRPCSRFTLSLSVLSASSSPRRARRGQRSARSDGQRRAQIGRGTGGRSSRSVASEEKETDSVASEDLKSAWWFRPLIRRRERRKRSQMFTAAAAEAEEEATGRATAPCVVSNRGMSPAADESDCGSESGYSTASSGVCRMPSPGRRAGPHRRRRRRRGRGISGLGVWLSPLVRANPGGQRGQAAEAGFSGDLRGGSNPIQHHYQPPHHRRAPGGAASLGLNRSRKLVDLGRG